VTGQRWQHVGKWEGGYIRQKQGGRPVYVIERVVGGRRFHVSTGASTLGAAVRHLARFEANPSAYSPSGDAQDALRLSAELVLEYRAHQLQKGLTREWADTAARCLADWTEALGRADLRAVELRALRDALGRWPRSQDKHIKALKGFCRWLRQERGLLRHAEDASLDLRVPQYRPEQWKRRKVVPHEDVSAVLRLLPQPIRDMLHLLTATAWHVSEVRRFASAGEIVRPTHGPLAVLVVRHKSGELHRTPLHHPEHLEAAMRLRGASLPSRVTTARQMRRACDEARAPRFGLGVMRHSVLTWAHERGASAQQTSEFAGHKSTATTRRHYLDLAVPTVSVPVLRLL